MGPAARVMAENVRKAAVRAVADSLRAGGNAAERAARVEECVRELEAEKAKMEVFRRELPISVHLIADVIEWLKEELAQQQRRRPAAEVVAPAPAVKKRAAPAEVRPEADDKRSWMSSAQLWSCGSVDDDSSGNSTGVAAGAKRPANKVSNASFMPLNGLPAALARSTADATAEKPPAAMPVPELSLSAPAIDRACPATRSATSSAVTDAGAQRQLQAQRKARRCWSPELHRRFVAALQRLGGAQAATPKQIRELMKVDGLTNDEVKSHLQKYRLHTRRASSDGGGDQQAALWSSSPSEQQYATSQHSTSQSGSPQGPLQLTVSSRAVSATGGDSCDGDDGDEEDGKSESYSWEMQQRGGTKMSSLS